MSASRRSLYFNDQWKAWHSTSSLSTEQVHNFHRSLPNYKQTPLVKLDELAYELGVRAVYLKDEGDRFDLPSFKILGASWGTFRAIASQVNLSLDSDLATLKKALAGSGFSLYAATDGNHGRAVARMGHWLGLGVEIFVPSGMRESTIQFIESEGATVTRSTGTYDDAVREAQAASKKQGGVLIQDFAFEGYEDVPQWIVDGYSTMMAEIDEQLGPQSATHVFVPVGVGSFAQAVTSHFRREGRSTSVIGVEPDTAACLWKSLSYGHSTAIETTSTIMAGLDCGTVSTNAWPILSKGVSASLTVSDYEAHSGSTYLASVSVSAGPCGGSTIAALRRLSSEDKSHLGIDGDSIIILPCTEGSREYDTPLDISVDDPIKLTQTLVQINSANPSMGSIPGPGETSIARYIAAWLEHRDLEAHWIESTKERPSIVGVMRGSGGGKSLMFNGHIGTVTLAKYDDDPLSGTIADGKLYGRGAADMKCGVAAAMVALANSKHLGLSGDVIFAGVADEEDLSIGTKDVLQAGWRADGAIVNEPTTLCVVNAHKGSVWLEVNVHGIASHGSRADLGVDAIAKAGHFLAELDRHAQRLQESMPNSHLGPPTIHASLINGGEEASFYPALCTITLERRTFVGETASSVEQEVRELLEKVQSQVEGFKFDLRATASRPAFESAANSTFCNLVCAEVAKAMVTSPTIQTVPYWTDCALLAAEGIPALLWGPIGEGLHAKEEWVDVESIRTVTKALTNIAAEFCR